MAEPLFGKLDPAKLVSRFGRQGGKILQATPQGQGIVGSDIFEITSSGVVNVGKFDPNIPNQNFAFQYNPEFGLKSTAGGTFDTASFFQEFTPEAKEEARIATSNFGLGTGAEFRPRREGETLDAYLRAKQSAGVGNIVLPTPELTAQRAKELGLEAQKQPVQAGTAPGQRIPSPEALQGLREQDLARTTGTAIYRRDLGAEQAALGDYAKRYGAPKNDADWRKFHEFVYEGKGRDTVRTGDISQDTEILRGDALQDVGKITLPETPTQRTSPQATIAESQSTQKTTDEYIKILTSSETEAGKKESTLSADVEALFGKLEGRAEFRAEEEKKAGVETLRSELVKINNELGIKTAAFEKAQAEIAAQPISMRAIIGQGAQLRALAQADIGYLQARAQALQNNITFAQETADRAVETKYAPILEEIEIKMAQLELLKPQLSKEEKVLAEARQALLQDQRDAILEQKNQAKAIQATVISAIESGIVDGNVLSRISKAGSLEQATLIMQQNLPSPDIQHERDEVVRLHRDYPDARIDINRDTLAQAQAKLPNSLIYRQQTRLAGDRGTPSGVIPTPAQPTAIQPPTFQEYVRRVEQELGMTIADPTKPITVRAGIGGQAQTRNLLEEYNNLIARQQTQVSPQQLANLSPLARQVVNDPSILSTLTPTMAGELRKEIAENGITVPQTLDLESKIALEQDLKKDFSRTAEDAKNSIRQIDIMNQSFEAAKKDKSKMNAASQGVLVVFQKMLDPTSVVRESEYARSGTGLSLEGRIQGAVSKLKEGGAGVSIKDLNSFVSLANQYYKQIYRPAVIDEAQLTKATADAYGLNLDLILTRGVLDLLNETPRLQDANGNIYEYDSFDDPDYQKDLSSGFTRI